MGSPMTPGMSAGGSASATMPPPGSAMSPAGDTGNHTYASQSETSYGYSPAETPTHSYSTAQSAGHYSLGRDSTGRPAPSRRGRMVSWKVQMLDDSVINVEVPVSYLGFSFKKNAKCYSVN